MPTAVLIDGGYFLKRFPACYPLKNKLDSKEVARTAFELALSHLREGSASKGMEIRHNLHRIFFYDCPPLLKRAHKPISRLPIDFAKTSEAAFRLALHAELRCLRKTALRLGHLSEQAEWSFRPDVLKNLLGGRRTFDSLTDADFHYDARQKGVDMRIGIDISTLAYKRVVDQIVLVAGDADFVPAAKLARREGLDFVLDPMWKPVHDSLMEHVDGVRSTCPRPLTPKMNL